MVNEEEYILQPEKMVLYYPLFFKFLIAVFVTFPSLYSKSSTSEYSNGGVLI